jgi:four helix bundle protein
MTKLTTTAPHIRSHRDLVVWQRAMQLATECYRVTRYLPPEERFGMQAQIRRAAVSVPANIAEGHGRLGRGDYVRSLSFARGSLMEVGCLLELGPLVGVLGPEAIGGALSLADEVARMLWVLIERLGSRQLHPRRW